MAKLRYHLEVSDDYLTEVVVHPSAIVAHARRVAREHGGSGVYVYPGPIRSGVNALFHVSPKGRVTHYSS